MNLHPCRNRGVRKPQDDNSTNIKKPQGAGEKVRVKLLPQESNRDTIDLLPIP